MAIERRALLVLGMHRSGTSALTRVLNIYGAALPAHLLPANSGNTAGYWESPAIVGFHEEYLTSVGSRWDSPVWLSLDSAAAAGHEHASRLASLIEAEFGDAPLIVVKDPRLCRLIPLWNAALALLKIQPLGVMVVRHPLEAAASIHRRDGMPEGAALLLWLQYVLAAEQGSRSLPRAMVRFDELLQNGPGAIERIQRELGLAFPVSGPDAGAEAEAFLQPSLRHERVSEGEVQGQRPLSGWLGAVWSWFVNDAHDGNPREVADLDRVRTELAEAEQLFGPSLDWHLAWERQRAAYFMNEASSLRERADIAERSAGELESQLADVTIAASERAGQVQQLASRLSSADTEIGSLRDELRVLQGRLTASEASGAALREEIRRLESSLLVRAGDWARRFQHKLSGGE